MGKKIFATSLLAVAAWCEWFVADQVELPFITRCVAFVAFVLSVLSVLSVWRKQ